MSEERLPLDGPGAPPRKNGELVFAAPWESRVFGMTMALCDAGVIEYREFQEHLIEEIARWEKADRRDAPSWSYYERWARALERLLERKGLCAGDELRGRTDAFRRRAPGHDHEPTR